MVRKKAWSVIAIAVLVLLTAVCGIGGYRGPHLPQPIFPVISTPLPDPVGVSPDGLKIVSWDRDQHRPVVFETHGKATPVVLNSSHCIFRVPDVQFSWDGKQIVGGCTVFDLTVWNTVTGEATNHLRCRVSPYFVAAWSRDGHYLAAACELEKVTVWELPSGKEIAAFQPHNGTVSQLAFTPQGQLVSAGSDGWVRFEDVSGHVVRSHEFGNMIKEFVLQQDSRQLVVHTVALSLNDAKVYVWNIDLNKQRRLPGLDEDRMHLLALSPDGAFLAVRTGNSAAVYSLRQNQYAYGLGEGVKAAVFGKPHEIVAITYNGVQTWSCCT